MTTRPRRTSAGLTIAVMLLSAMSSGLRGAPARRQQPSVQVPAQSLPPDVVAVSARVRFARAVGGPVASIDAAYVTRAFFQGAGAAPALGRFFVDDEYVRAVGANLAVLSYRFWVEEFDSSAGVIGSVVEIDGRPVAVIGIAREDFRPPAMTGQLWMPRVPGTQIPIQVGGTVAIATGLATSVRTFTTRSGDPREFVPLVEPAEGEGVCDVRREGPDLRSGEYALGLSFRTAGQLTQRINVSFARDGSPLRYSDARGDLRYPFAGTVLGPRTTIFIDFQTSRATFSNAGPNVREDGLVESALVARNAMNLGPPEKYIKRITTECGKLLEKR
jgi:hypothetical protein